MSRFTPLVLAPLATLCLACAAHSPPVEQTRAKGPPARPPSPEVEIDLGRLLGHRTRSGVLAFRGVPYRAAPARFERAGPPEPWTGVRDARRPGPACPQAGVAPFEQQSEDCLTVDVWTPGTGGPRPVIVFLHAGGWTHGGTRDPVLDGGRLALNADAVVVTVNHRLGVFGWSRVDQIGGATDGANLGLLDLTDALFWVNQHIERFGGDPGNVTIAGASAGGAAVVALMTFPPARGAFHRAIAMSGSGSRIRYPRHAARVTEVIMDAAGVDDLDGLRRLPTARLVAAQQQVIEAAVLGDHLFGPVLDGHRITDLPIRRLADGAAAEVPLMIGTTRDEARLLLDEVPYARWITPSRLFDALPGIFGELGHGPKTIRKRYKAARPKSSENDLALDIATDALFRVPAIRVAEARARSGGETFLYRFDWYPRRQAADRRAVHGIDVPVLFGTHHKRKDIVGQRPPEALVNELRRVWSAFARVGRPADPSWTAYRPGRRAVKIWNKRPRVYLDPGGPQRRLWASLPFDGASPMLVPSVPRR